MSSLRGRAAAVLSLTLTATSFFAAAPAATLAAPAAPAAPVAKTAAKTVDLASALATDGTFTGAPGLAGTIDASAWTLTSNLAAGQPPRFQPAGSNIAGGYQHFQRGRP